jgi:pimeloyl-ACP methyl ester carboxylesterase
MSYFTTSDNCKLYYEEHGTGEHLIFIHGWTANTMFFTAQIEHFAKHYHVIAYDARGHCRSDQGEVTEQNLTISRLAEDLHELIEGLGLDNVNLAGWSMGTLTLLAYVREFGCQYVNKLCFIDMTPKIVCNEGWKLSIANADETIDFLALCVKDWNAACDFFLPLALVKGYPKDSEGYKLALSAMQSNNSRIMMYLYTSMASEDLRSVLKDISVPVLLAYSGDGLICTPATGEYMANHIKNSKLVIFDGCGHGLFMDNPDKFNAELDAFLKEA